MPLEVRDTGGETLMHHAAYNGQVIKEGREGGEGREGRKGGEGRKDGGR